MELVIKGSLAKYIAARAREEGVDVEELLARLVAEELDEDARVRLYLELHQERLSEAEALEREGDLVQAGEKLWGAVCSLLSAIAELRGWRHFSHRDYCDIVERLVAELGEPELSREFASAERLHANYYHAFLRPESFEIHRDAVLKLIGRLKGLLAKEGFSA